MPPTPSTPAVPVDAICNSCGTNTGLDRIDATKLNDLFNTLTNRLSRDVQGNFFVEGAKTGKDTRHGQLGDLYSLRAQLDGFKTTMDKYIALHAPKEKEMDEKPASINMNKNQKAAIAEMVESQVKERFRDLSIRCERLEEDVSKVKDRKGGAKAGAGVMKTQHDDCPANAAIARVNKRLDEVLRDQAAQKLAAKTSNIGGRVTELKNAVADIELWKNRKDAQQSSIVSQLSDIEGRETVAKERLDAFEIRTTRDFNIIAPNLARLDSEFRSEWEAAADDDPECVGEWYQS
ncbi:hypothetical protein LTR97_006871 [Elasticomyces elasticus]|uniref:Uncharacterized protein n=1 Tax=Elasticomyces elasticus TaxID=574655 RepID=A0AAN7VQ16_9PEZI|nr:hypothetical protein LTR97_006871 [Elasticomyces elasticus]